MKKVFCRSLVLALGVALVSSAAYAKKTTSDGGYKSYEPTADWTTGIASVDKSGGPRAASPAVTKVLLTYTFEQGTVCKPEGGLIINAAGTLVAGGPWVTTDITQQTGHYWHLDNLAGMGGGFSVGGLHFGPITGGGSLWMAARVDVANLDLCGYAALPGYGNGWNQAWCSKDCLDPELGPTADLDVSMSIKFDTEPSYDYTALEYTTDCAGNVGWTEIDGGNPLWTGADSLEVDSTYAVGTADVKVRVRFTADTSWSNEDGFYPGLGVVVDNLSWETKGPEGFEAAFVYDVDIADATADWISCNTPGFGNYLALFKRATADYLDQCTDNLTCYWAAIQNSAELYDCDASYAASQRIVPHVNVRDEYISNEIWSPIIPLDNAGVGSDFRLKYTVYRDLPLDNLIFHIWHVRTVIDGCPGPWKDRNFVYYGDNRDWIVAENAIGTKVDVANGEAIQVAIGVIDMCPFWCGVFGTGDCHTPAPYIDTVEVTRIDNFGPQWDVRDLDTFQDTFATDGTTTGTARADEANDTKPSTSSTFTPGDSAIVLFLVDPKYAGVAGSLAVSGLNNDPTVSTFIGRNKTKKAVYMWVAVWPQGQTGKEGDNLSEGTGVMSNHRYPHIPALDYTDGNGVPWTAIRMDFTYIGTATVPGWGTTGPTQPRVDARFNVDLHDSLFTPCDTVCYFYGATSLDGTTYYAPNYGSTTSIAEIAANAQEFTILPAGGWKRGGDILYVDGTDGFGGASGTSAIGNQPFFDGAFQVLGLSNKIDRFDVRGPSSGVSNRPGGRVYNVGNQLNQCYEKILWDCGPLSITLGDGSGDPEKTDDYLMLNTFLANLGTVEYPADGGVYLCGSRIAQYLIAYEEASATDFIDLYMQFDLLSDNHRSFLPGLPVSPPVIFWPGRCFSDNFVAFGGCPQLDDFDVLAPLGDSEIEMSYQTSQNANGAILSNLSGDAAVILSGFSLANIRDDELDGISDRAEHLHDIIEWLGNPLGQTTGTGPALKNGLSQNYPNPFNPQTTIAFSIKDRGNVSLKVYNVAGQLVRTLANENRAAGPYTVVWDGRNDSGQPVSSGVYFYKLVANSFSQTKKMVLLK